MFESGNNRLQTSQGPRNPATGSSCSFLPWQDSARCIGQQGSNYMNLTWAAPQTLRPTQRESVGNQASHWADLFAQRSPHRAREHLDLSQAALGIHPASVLSRRAGMENASPAISREDVSYGSPRLLILPTPPWATPPTHTVLYPAQGTE